MTPLPVAVGTPRSVSIIYNPVAGWRRRGMLNTVVEALDARGMRVSVAGTTGPGNATDLALRAVADGAEAIVAAGGDGTIAEVVAGMIGSGIPLGIVPMGTANVLAGELRLPRRPEAVARVIHEARTRRLHVPRADERPFLLMTGAGFDGEVVAAVTPALKRRFGKAAFAFKGLRALLRGPSAPIRVEADGVVRHAEWAVVTNVSRYGGPHVLAPDADPGAPELTVCLFDHALPLALAGHLFRIGIGAAAYNSGVTMLTAREVRLSSTAPVPVQIDGDAAGELPRRVRATGEFVEILCP